VASFSSKFLKKRFSPYNLQTIVDRTSPFVAVLDKPTQGGSSVAEGVILSGPKGQSFQFQAAQAVSADGSYTFTPQGATTAITVVNTGNGASNYDEFISTYGDYHGVATVTAKAVAGSKTNMDAYLRQLNEVMESEIGAFIEVGARKLLGPVGGALAQVTNIATGAQAGAYTLSNPSDAYNFSVGMVIMFATTNGNGTATVVGTTQPAFAYVQAVFPDGDGPNAGAQLYIGNAVFNGTVTPTLPQPGNGGATPANNAFIFRLGDVAQGTDLSDAQIRSFQSWVTLAAAQGTAFNVNRSQDARLSGFRLPSVVSAGMSVLDRIQLLATIGRSQAGAKNATLCVVGPRTWQQLATEAQSYGTLQFTKEMKLGVELLTIMTCNGPTQVMNDPHCVESDIWLFTRENLKLYNYDGFPCLDEGDGNEILRQAGAAGYEARWHAFTCATVNGKPWTHGRSDSGIAA
jgi:hypothetical protein